MPKRQTLSQSEYQDLAGFRHALRQFIHFSEEAAKRAGVTPQQHQALLAIKGFPGRDRVTVGELAERLQLRPHTTVELADRLEQLRLIERHRDEKDRRRVHLKLTSRGEHVLDRLSIAHKEQLRHIAPRLSSTLRQFAIEHK